MIDHYTIKSAPAVHPKDILKKLDEIKDGDTEGLRRFQQFRVRIELFCEPTDLKKIDAFLKELSRPRR